MNNTFKLVAHKSLILSLVFVAVLFVGIMANLPAISRYFSGALLNGVPINTPSETNRYAYAENLGWIDFNPTGGNVQVGDIGLTGYAYAENTGWIKLGYGEPPYLNTTSTNWGVVNDDNGNLSGYAYGENIGWIDFNPTGGGVTINTSTGAFSGYAYGENTGWISFSGTGYGVVTDWRPNSGGGGGGGTSSYSITASATEGGSISPASTLSMVYGASQKFTITPNTGYEIKDVLVDGVSVGPVEIYNFSNIFSSHTISVSFSAINSAPENQAVPENWCYNFNKNLGFTNSGTDDVSALHTALQKQGFSFEPDTEKVYSQATSNSVIQFQKKYNISPQSGYVGNLTRAKLNNLYGCSQAENPDISIQPTTNPPSSLNPTTPPPSQLQTGNPPDINTVTQTLEKILELLKKISELLLK